jgi:hypothetical protein
VRSQPSSEDGVIFKQKNFASGGGLSSDSHGPTNARFARTRINIIRNGPAEPAEPALVDYVQMRAAAPAESG